MTELENAMQDVCLSLSTYQLECCLLSGCSIMLVLEELELCLQEAASEPNKALYLNWFCVRPALAFPHQWQRRRICDLDKLLASE